MTDWSSLWPKRGSASPLQTWLLRLATLSSALGGAVIFVVALIVTVSVIMRNIGLRGISGDFELVQMSCVYSAGLFLPLCQLKKGHVMVDLFTTWLPRSAKSFVDKAWTLSFAAAWAVLCILMFEGMAEIKAYGDRTMLLSIPIWWSFIPGIAGCGLSSVIAFAQALFWRTDSAVAAGH